MDKETLAILISTLSEMEMIELYKIKKINNLGFRANTTDDVRKNRQVLENNLLKPINMKHTHGFFIFKASNSKVEIDGLALNELQELCESKGYSKVLITLYAIGNKVDFKKIVTEYIKKTNEPSLEHTLEVKEIDRVSETKYIKIMKKLETKLINLTVEYQKKENNYKLQLENTNNLILDLRKENTLYKHRFNRANKENKRHEQEFYTVANENVNLKDVNGMLHKQTELYNNEIHSLKKEILLFSEQIKQFDNKTSNSTNKPTAEDSDRQIINTTKKYEIVVFGESSEIILNDIHHINFKFIEGEAINKFIINDYNTTKYNEIWIIHYDLTQKEKRNVNMKKIESIKKNEIKNIYNLKDLNQIIVNLKKVRG